MMRGAGWLLAAALVAGCATDNSGGDNAGVSGSQIGKVQGIYVEQYSGIYVDRQMAATESGKPVWVYVTFDRSLKDGTRFATAVLEQDSGVEPGDLVQVRLARDHDQDPAATPARNQVVALIAKHDTARARAFGSAPGRPAVETVKQAAVDQQR
jgi:hypothetical protein